MQFLRSNTSVILTVGPFFDKTDGVTLETALTITNERITLTADTDAGSAPTNILDNVTGATSGTANDLNYITGNDAGMMQLQLSAADTNRVGRMLLSITDAANHVPVFHEYFVLPAVIYDWLTAGAAPLTPTTAGRTLDVSAAGEAGLDINNIAALTAGPLALFGIVESGTAQSATATTLVGRAAATNDIVKAGNTLFVYDSTLAYWQSVVIDSVSGDTFTIAAWPTATPAATITYYVMGTPQASAALPVPCNPVQLGGDAQSLTDLKDFADAGYDPSTNKVQGVVLTDTVTTYTGNTVQTGDAFARLGAPAGASVSADVAIVDTVVDAIKAKTDSLTFTQAGHVDANIQRINDVAITGNGQVGTEFNV